MYLIVVYWLVGFVLSALLVLPFVIFRNVKSFAAAGAADIRGS